MILIDANLLIYAHINSFPQHTEARKWLDLQLNQNPRVGMPWQSLLAFVRITSNSRVFENPLTVSQAWKQVQSWLDVPSTWIPNPEEQHREILGKLIDETKITSQHLTDAHLAAIAIEHGLQLCSTDSDFARFPKLNWVNPLKL